MQFYFLTEHEYCQYRAERTPGEVAVSERAGKVPGSVRSWSGDTSQKQAYDETSPVVLKTNSSPLGQLSTLGFKGQFGFEQDLGTPPDIGPGNYLESCDNVSSWLSTTCDKPGLAWFVPGECENGHRFGKEIVCGKEWCQSCGEDGSKAHNRRFVRWLPKVQQCRQVGYFVFTIPEESRDRYRSKRALTELGRAVQEMLKAFGFRRGLRRWHWFGDKSTRWNPHLNILVDRGYIPDELLEKVKTAYAGILGVSMADVNYHYQRSPGRMVHTLKYVTRATFHDWSWDPDMAIELHGFRNMVVWGRGLWKDKPAWSLKDLKGKARADIQGLDIQAIEKLAAGICPVCGRPVTWNKALPAGLLSIVPKHPFGAGYWRLQDIPPPYRNKEGFYHG